MAVALDSVAHSSANGSNSYTTSLSTAGTNRLILVIVHTSNNTALVPSSASVTFVQIGSNISFAGNGLAQIYRAFASTQLTSDTITLTGTGNPQSTVCIATFSGTDTTGSSGSGAIGASNTVSSGGASSSSASVTTTRRRSLVVGLFGETNSQTITAFSGQTLATSDVVQSFSRAGIVYQNFTTFSIGEVVTDGITWGGSSGSGGAVIEVLDSSTYDGSNKPGNNLKYLSVSDGMSRAEVAN